MSRPVVSVVMPFAGDGAAAAAAIETLLALDLRPGDELILADNSVLPVASTVATGRSRSCARSPSARRRMLATPAPPSRTTTGSCSSTPIAWCTTGCSTPTSRCPSPTMSGRWRARCSPRPAGDTLAARYGAARGFLSQEAHLRHPYRPRAVAANLLVRRAAFEQVGGFYEGVRAGEDTDFSWRIQAAGWRLELRTEASVEHRYRTTSEGSAQPMARLRGRPGVARAPLRRLRARAGPAPRIVASMAPGSPGAAGGPAHGSKPELVAARAGRLERGGYALLDALLSAEELAGFALSNRPSGLPRATTCAGRAGRRPLSGPGRSARRIRAIVGRRPRRGRGAPGVAGCRRSRASCAVDYREDDGFAARLVALGGLALRIRCAACLTACGAGPGEPELRGDRPRRPPAGARARRSRARARWSRPARPLAASPSSPVAARRGPRQAAARPLHPGRRG